MVSALTEPRVLPETPPDDSEFDLDLRVGRVARHLQTEAELAMATGVSYNAPGCASCNGSCGGQCP
jgi:hypothetical protein